jgi:hypothetical protein
MAFPEKGLRRKLDFTEGGVLRGCAENDACICGVLHNDKIS